MKKNNDAEEVEIIANQGLTVEIENGEIYKITNMEKQLECPFCDTGVAELTQVNSKINYKGVTHPVIEYFYVCNDCQQDFTTTESDGATFAQIPGFPIGRQ